MTGNKVLPQAEGPEQRRSAIDLPDVYSSGGEVDSRAMPTVNLGGRDIPITANTIDIKDGYKLVPLHTSKIEDSFQNSDMYVGPFGARGIGKRYEQFADFQKDADAIEAPSLSVNSSGHVNFGNGRHRYSYMRDNGVPAIHVSMHPNSIRNARKHGMIAGPVVDNPVSTFDYDRRDRDIHKASGGEVSGYENGGMPGDDGDSLLPQGRAQQRMTGNLAAGPQPTNIAKEPGGQWLSGSVESAVEPLKVDRMASLRGVQSPADALAVSKERLAAMDARQASGGTSPLNDRDFQALRAGHERVVKDASRHVAINDWVGSTLKKYIQRDMATEHDPVRALAEKGILHLSEDELLSNQKWKNNRCVAAHRSPR
jgi:hypothetical protein